MEVCIELKGYLQKFWEIRKLLKILMGLSFFKKDSSHHKTHTSSLKVIYIEQDQGICCLQTNIPLYKKGSTPIDILVQSLRVLCIFDPVFSYILNILCKYYGNMEIFRL